MGKTTVTVEEETRLKLTALKLATGRSKLEDVIDDLLKEKKKKNPRAFEIFHL